MGRLYYESDQGLKREIREIENITGKGPLIVKLSFRARPDLMEEMEASLTEKLGRTVVVVDTAVDCVFGLEDG